MPAEKNIRIVMAKEAPGAVAGRAALVTGASSGIGRAIALALAASGSDLGIVGRDHARLARTADAVRALGAAVLPMVADLTEPKQIEHIVDEVQMVFGGLDVIIHSAGIYYRGEMAQADIRCLDALYQTNVRAPYRLTQALIPLLENRPSDIIFINSTQGQSARPGIGQYASTQHALKAVADSLRAELNSKGVRVTTLHIGRTATPLQEQVFLAEGRDYIPECLIQPQDVAELVVTALGLPRRTQVAEMTVWPTDPSVPSPPR
jgi:NADP-dependent 3-hydroxy acid dehydrogenase YdfG